MKLCFIALSEEAGIAHRVARAIQLDFQDENLSIEHQDWPHLEIQPSKIITSIAPPTIAYEDLVQACKKPPCLFVVVLHKATYATLVTDEALVVIPITPKQIWNVNYRALVRQAEIQAGLFEKEKSRVL